MRYSRDDSGLSLSFVDQNGFTRVHQDPNHFSNACVRRKKTRARHDLAEVLGRWPVAARECRRVGLDVRNASPGTALDCFPVTEFEAALEWIRNE